MLEGAIIPCKLKAGTDGRIDVHALKAFLDDPEVEIVVNQPSPFYTEGLQRRRIRAGAYKGYEIKVSVREERFACKLVEAAAGGLQLRVSGYPATCDQQAAVWHYQTHVRLKPHKRLRHFQCLLGQSGIPSLRFTEVGDEPSVTPKESAFERYLDEHESYSDDPLVTTMSGAVRAGLVSFEAPTTAQHPDIRYGVGR